VSVRVGREGRAAERHTIHKDYAVTYTVSYLFTYTVSYLCLDRFENSIFRLASTHQCGRACRDSNGDPAEAVNLRAPNATLNRLLVSRWIRSFRTIGHVA
jgi:hypothetical protein